MRRTWVAIGLLIFSTAAAYWGIHTHDFVNYDDNDYVTANPRVQAGLTWDGVLWAFGNLHGEKTYWHPLTWLSHMLDCQLFGVKAGPHHVVSLVLHILNTALLFLVLKRATGAHWRSALVAALFALHPLQVDTVAWVSERKNLLCGLFWMVSLGAYVRYAEKPSFANYALLFASMAVGLLAKPILVTLPFVLMLLDFWPLGRIDRVRDAPAGEDRPNGFQTNDGPHRTFRRSTLPRLLLEKLPLLILSAASSIVTLAAHRDLGMLDAREGLSFWHRVENAIVSYARYLAKTVWPDDLSVLYLHPGTWPPGRVLLSFAIILLISVAVVWRARRQPYLFVGWFWFLGVLVPTIGLQQVGEQSMADRFAYLPLIGLFIMAVWGVWDFALAWHIRPIPLVATTWAIITCLGICTARQQRHWQNSFTLFEQALRVDPMNFAAHGSLAAAYIAAGDLAQGREHANEALRIRPSYVEARLQLGMLAVMEQKPDEAAVEYARYLEQAPSDLEARAAYAVALTAARRPLEAIVQYHELLQRKPDWPEALNNLAWLRATHPQAQARDGAEAVRLAERACSITRRRQATYVGTLAAAYAEAGRFAEAITAAEEARSLARAHGQEALAETNTKLLEFYRANRPYRQE